MARLMQEKNLTQEQLAQAIKLRSGGMTVEEICIRVVHGNFASTATNRWETAHIAKSIKKRIKMQLQHLFDKKYIIFTKNKRFFITIMDFGASALSVAKYAPSGPGNP